MSLVLRLQAEAAVPGLCGAGGQTQGLKRTRQALYQWNCAPAHHSVFSGNIAIWFLFSSSLVSIQFGFIIHQKADGIAVKRMVTEKQSAAQGL